MKKTLSTNPLLRIAIVLEEGRLGGPQIYVLNLAKALSGLVDILIFMPKDNSTEFQQMCLGNKDIPFLTTSLTKITKESLPFLKFLCFSLWEIFKLATLFSKGNYNLIYACGVKLAI